MCIRDRSNTIDMKWMNDSQFNGKIKAVAYVWSGGMEGGNAVADILFGELTPSGKLTTTWTKRYDDCPAAEEFSYLNGNLETEEYAEGIYVGYRYFDSFGIEPIKAKKVVIPVFGRNTDASLGIFKLKGDSNLLNLLYKAGMGARRSEGKGKFDILA